MDSLADFFDAKGLLARQVDNYTFRPEQYEMAKAVDLALAENHTLVTEAGTGVGKTFAYLVPAILSGKRVFVSTATKTLQDQLFHRDIPTIRASLNVPVSVSMLKGRANYLCLYRLKNLLPPKQFDPITNHFFERISQWEKETVSGDITELSDESGKQWSDITSTTDNCLNQECPELDKCYVLKARKKAAEADIVVVNHHLLCADMQLKEDGFGSLLPSADAIIIDEAHQIEAIATRFFGNTLSAYKLKGLIRDVKTEQIKASAFLTQKEILSPTLQAIDKALADFRLICDLGETRSAWRTIQHKASLSQALNHIIELVGGLFDGLTLVSASSKGLERCADRCFEILGFLKVFTADEDSENIKWLETTHRSFSLHNTPLHIGASFTRFMQQCDNCWIFTSATLSVGENFDHFVHRLGLTSVNEAKWNSPFDYKNNALIYLPKNLPLPNETTYTEKLIKAVIPVLKASKGRAFLLFTSVRALTLADKLLAEENLPFPVLTQGSCSRSVLLNQFRKKGNAILLGTSSFWEGVDVRGEALSCVIIDKLPFDVPNDPVFQARADVIKANGLHPFMEYMLPNAVINLKQGAGRLIRDETDSGVLVLCDPRISNKSYGKIFLKNLPSMTRTRDLDVVTDFFDNRREISVSQDKEIFQT